MAYSGIAKVQHYVPQFLLRNFGTGKKDQLNVFDKQTEKAYKTNCKNVACESRFYDFNFEGTKLSIEPALSNIESIAKPIIKGISEKETLDHLSAQDRANISIFLAIQFTRTKHFRENFSQIRKLLGETLKKRGFVDDQLEGVSEYITQPSENDLSIMAARAIHEAPEDYSVHFASKIWLLAKAATNTHFVIGDNPISLHNETDMKPYGNLGIAVKGIEINFPITPKLALLLWCPSILELFIDGQRKYESLGITCPSSIKDPIDSSNSGKPLLFSSENVVNFNSRQVFYAERYIFSDRDDFDLVKEMVEADSRLKFGPRMGIA